MELKDLSTDQRKALAVFAVQMMVADHSAAAAESQRIDWLEQELGVTGAIAAADYFIEPPLSLFPDRAARLLLLGELYVVALADGRRHPNENDVLKRLAASFGFGAPVLADLLAWAESPAASRPPVETAVKG
ncbi:TerB family tellurite resistance protein [Magnetospirillum sp. UT-4]|uniref:TerB family tellurite resistance protein n=1 Tax=Magnetospirillum sp. UT-4 TaxID=2681467 RepID=UPI001383BC26|nr:TerB family tellurite resistance protein [Magnetospirillum sp. UT-4]CAA7616560.1 hypothetical protein MTBUT4_230009 [Magnetospirillum sp. UT-4]